MDHPQSFRVVGFFDQPVKDMGTKQVVCFRQEDRFTVRHIPTPDQLREYATLKGYPVLPNKCDAIYEVIGEGQNYCWCTECFPSLALPESERFIDNRNAREG